MGMQLVKTIHCKLQWLQLQGRSSLLRYLVTIQNSQGCSEAAAGNNRVYATVAERSKVNCSPKEVRIKGKHM